MTESPRPRVLVVDDHPANVQALYQALTCDYQVLVATNGEQALTLCEARQPDLVLLDVVMPGIDGYEVCERLKSGARTQHIPVIFVTSHGDEAAETRGLGIGAADFITKPINPAVVRARVKTQLTLKSQSDLLRQLVFTDGLTGVSNRRCFDAKLMEEWQRSRRNGLPLSLAIIDVDFFKRYNDHYGHQAGDQCLRQVAQAMAAMLKRPADMLARYGGEEFACILPETGPQGALEVAEQLEACVRAERIPHADSTVHDNVTVSLGVATREGGGNDTIAQLLADADRQLYRAKAEGRGRACIERVDGTGSRAGAALQR
jgi:diguanylate cyclase (GGDEF)-like protein